MTVIRAVAVVVPPSPLAVRVYVVEELGDTDREPLVLTSPIPWSMETLVAPVVVQDKRGRLASFDSGRTGRQSSRWRGTPAAVAVVVEVAQQVLSFCIRRQASATADTG